MIKILLVEDDKSIVSALCEFLEKEGFCADFAPNVQTALSKAEQNEYDLLLLDISLPDGNGFSVCRAVKEKYGTPVIFLTASGDEYSVVTGLDMGGDDYIEKPYRPRELISRIRSVLRRSGKTSRIISAGGLTVNTEKRCVFKNGEEIFLSALEYRLLMFFFSHKDAVLTREQLLSEIWDAAGDFVNDNTLTVYIKRLREKIEDDPQSPKIILTVRGFGYRLSKGENQ